MSRPRSSPARSGGDPAATAPDPAPLPADHRAAVTRAARAHQPPIAGPPRCAGFPPSPVRRRGYRRRCDQAAGSIRLLDRTDGDILVFLPGMAEIRRTAAALQSVADERELLVLPLHGDLPAEEQDRALLPQDRRRIVLATNVAETSVTVEGISGVVDTGLARMMTFDADLGLDRLVLSPIARDAAEQRTGRAGRLRPGVCVRLWSEASHRQRAGQTEPEVRRVDLAGAVLHLLCLGEASVTHFPWLEPPPQAT